MQPLGVREAVGVDHHQHAQLLGLLPERREGRVGQLAAVDVGQHLHALEAELGRRSAPAPWPPRCRRASARCRSP